MIKPPLSETHPELASQASGWDPFTVTKSDRNHYEWRCEKGHTWRATVKNRTSSVRPSGCPTCAGRKTESLKSTNPKIADEAVGWNPELFTAGQNVLKKWICPIGHEYEMSIGKRTLGRNCPICAGQRILIGYNDLNSTDPEVALQAFEWDPKTLTRVSGRKRKFICELGHVWDARISDRTKHGSGCPFCSGNAVLIGFNDLATVSPEISRELADADPLTFTAGSNTKVDWICSNNHRYTSTPKRRARGDGCPFCSGVKVLPGFNDLYTLAPELADEAQGWDPRKVSFKSGKKMKWKCSVGHTWTAMPHNRARGAGCPSCSNGGFDPNKEGWLYLIFNESSELLQVGVSNVLGERLDNHGTRGWVALDVRGPMDGSLAFEWEQSILHFLRVKGIKSAKEMGLENFSGYTESWDSRTLWVSKLRDLMDLVEAAEQSEI